MDDIERSTPVPNISPIHKIRARIYDRERRDLMNPFERNHQGQLTKRRKSRIKQTENTTADAGTPEKIEQDFLDYKSGLTTRLTFDRALILPEEPTSK
jgi:hypothetical protein